MSQYYLPFLFLLCLYGVQTLHEAGDALLQAVNGVMLGVVATEAVAQAAESISDELEVSGLGLKGKCWWHGISIPIPASELKRLTRKVLRIEP